MNTTNASPKLHAALRLFPGFLYAVVVVSSVGGHLASGADVTADNLEALGITTLRSDAWIEGKLEVGKIGHNQVSGYKLQVRQQEVLTHQEVEVTPGYYQEETVPVHTYGPITNSTTELVETYGTYTSDVWVEDWGYYTPSTEVPEYTEPETGVVTPGYTLYGSPVWQVIGGHYEQQTFWGVINSEYVTHTTEDWGIINTSYQMVSTYIPPVHESVTVTDYTAPVIHQTGEAANTVWLWENQSNRILELTDSGLSIPNTSDMSGSSRAILTATQFEQSVTQSPATGPYVSMGTTMGKRQLEVWSDKGQNGTADQQDRVLISGDNLEIKHTELTTANTTQSRITRISANKAEFGGEVTINGVLRVKPAGDLSMGIFTSGAQP